MPQSLVEVINNDPKRTQGLLILSSPVEARGLFGVNGSPKADVSVIVPGNDILGSALVHKVRNLQLAPGEEFHLTSNFCQAPKNKRFSILAYRRGNIFDVAGFITLSWSFQKTITSSSSPSPSRA